MSYLGKLWLIFLTVNTDIVFFCYWKSLTLEGETFFPPFLICKNWLQVFGNRVHFWMLLLQFSFDGVFSLSNAKAAATYEYGFNFIFCTCIAPLFWLVLHYDAKSYLAVSSCLVLVCYHHSSVLLILLLAKWNFRRMGNPESWTVFFISNYLRTVSSWIAKDIYCLPLGSRHSVGSWKSNRLTGIWEMK